MEAGLKLWFFPGDSKPETRFPDSGKRDRTRVLPCPPVPGPSLLRSTPFFTGTDRAVVAIYSYVDCDHVDKV